MKKFVLIAIAFCFFFAASSDASSQTRKVTKKRPKAELVKCYERGKVVYRTKCRLQKTNRVEAKIEPRDESYGLKTGGISDGSGGGGGIGNGRGQGMGAGAGLGNGSGSGSSDTNTDKKETDLPNTPTTGIKILSKPRPVFTEVARANKVSGKVVLRVTFAANGTIGAISLVSGLGNGLTEQAIMAARNIKFEPATRGGVPYTVTKIIEYNFIPE